MKLGQHETALHAKGVLLVSPGSSPRDPGYCGFEYRALKGRNIACARSARAFTLLEILIVLMIAGMITGVLALGYTRLASAKPSTPEAVFWQAVTAARKQALLSGREVRLAYTPAAASDTANIPAGLTMTWDNPDDPATPGERLFPFENMGDVILEFLSTQKGAQAIMVGGEVIETQTVPFMTFYGDGTCTPVRIQIRRDAGAAYTLSIDPWTCAQMLPPDDTQ